MDPAKLIGKIKEQVCMEHRSRRNYPNAWAKVADAETNRFYHQDEIDKQLSKKLILQQLSPFEHNNEGDSYFVSPDMHKSLVATCRCGRPRRGTHMAKCLQRSINPYQVGAPPDKSDAHAPSVTGVPRTSNSHIGFVQSTPNYRKLEQSMRYESPTFSMPGPRVTEAPYNVIIIG
ncbi:uncharacterized protein LOC115632909 [Scaptodrosophila lebanonensis]|uniref:Uncharacterized protein LOC115632909 n=1 Tax=Drosophila lebanonensis TaxID=7225 RepID=A0A6J2UCD8_DROLE|nr:uncharacterized protein LOC115632909 [Scaptodrosophila lebanonensis]